ncbi:phosphatase PAP2 family protein [Enterococcus sp. JM9B]|uniref:phosphatase PAP2 family protein n=1 Tax=Enterococcus sp. JM9B TaxID=1857216 RepID=UPI001374BD09|nr:phosphatase PAP2 family protein [Enterococcus sp. JM9B]KAF1303351.1 phospholipid phosphatase [Enterococcus sp. JM9B]
MKNKVYTQFIGSCFLLLFVFLGYVVKFYPQWVSGFDSVLTDLVRSPYPHWNDFYLWITKFGNPSTVIILTLAFLIVLAIGKHYAETAWLGIGVLGIAGILNPLIKLVFTRERPTLLHLVTEHSYSFPSGHSTGSMVLFGTLIFLVPTLFTSTTARWIARIFLGFIILAIGISRIYLGVHFPSDIIGGYSLGLGWLFLTYPLYQKFRVILTFKKKR